MLLLDVTDTLRGIFQESSYLAPFVVLLLCGIGLPLPEEVTLVLSGVLLHNGNVEFVPIVMVCSTAILLGDSIPFALGRRYGMSALRIRWVARILHPERFERMRKRYDEHGSWAVFACRFFAGVRIPGYFLAGTMGMSYLRFLILDVFGVLLSVPISIYLGALFGESIAKLQTKVQNLHLILASVALSLVLVLVLRRRWIRPSPPSGGPPGPSDTGGEAGG